MAIDPNLDISKIRPPPKRLEQQKPQRKVVEVDQAAKAAQAAKTQ